MTDGIKKALLLIPENAKKKIGNAEILLMNSKDILRVLKDKPVIIMTCNTRIKHVIPGIMRAASDMDAVVGFELAKSEGDINGGYTGMNPDIYSKTVIDYAKACDFKKPFFIHGDHITVKTTDKKDIESARELIKAELNAGYTSFAIDASFNEIPDNIRITTDLAQPILKAGIGLEVEVGEIKSAGQEGSLTTVAEAVEFISGLISNGVHPDMLAINNGSKHGNYLDGEQVSIDLERTREIFNEIIKSGVVIAQHGVTGTPLHLVGRFADYGIRKANVGTNWQNIAHDNLPEGLMNEMKAWAKENNKNIKMATKPFKEKIDNIPEEYQQKIEEAAYRGACEFFEAFRAKGTASMVLKGI